MTATLERFVLLFQGTWTVNNISLATRRHRLLSATEIKHWQGRLPEDRQRRRLGESSAHVPDES